MARKWLQSANVEVSDAGALSVSGACSSFTGGIKTLANATNAAQLVATATPCRLVWIGPRIDANGAALNTKPCFIGESAAQSTYDKGPLPIMPSNYEGLVIAIDDASKLWLKVGVNNEGVAYRIFA